MSSSVLFTRQSAKSKFRGVFAVVLATEYSVQGGEAQMQSKCPGKNSVWSQSRMFTWMVAGARGSRSNESTSQPWAAKPRPTEPVPLKSSSSRI